MTENWTRERMQDLLASPPHATRAREEQLKDALRASLAQRDADLCKRVPAAFEAGLAEGLAAAKRVIEAARSTSEELQRNWSSDDPDIFESFELAQALASYDGGGKTTTGPTSAEPSNVGCDWCCGSESDHESDCPAAARLATALATARVIEAARQLDPHGGCSDKSGCPNAALRVALVAYDVATRRSR